jgi:Carboxypeptidase regulatory-like domain
MNPVWSVCAENLRRGVKTRSARHLVLFTLVLLGLASFAFGQEATVVGTVTDPSGSVIPNVTITLTQSSTGQTRSLKTNDAGQYVAPDLNIGSYTIRAEVSGFKAVERKDVVLNVGDRSRIDFAMEVGSAQENVTVEAEAVKVQADSGEVSTVITGEQVSQLSTNGRSVYALFALTPGASSIQGDFVVPTAVSGDSNVSINGQRAGHNLQLLDGGENLDRGGSSGSVMPSMDAIAEFRNLTSNYSAEYGLSSAATITQVIKSGTKQFHASAWEFDRNDALDARNYFNPAPAKVAELRFNTYGFNLGGQVPLWKSHPTFFFYNMEWRSLVQGGLTNQPVPFADTYGGNFAANLPADVLDKTGGDAGHPIPNSGLHVPCQDQLSSAQVSAFNSAGITSFSTPATAGGACSANPGLTISQNPTFVPFPVAAIPGGLLDQNAQALLKAGIFPAPTSGHNFVGGNNSPTTVREEIARVDHQFSDKFSVFGHWVSEQTSQTYGTTQWSGDNVPTVSDVFGNPSYSAVIHTTYVVSPTLLNEAAFNYNGNRINIIPQGVFTAPADFAFQRLFPNNPNVDTRIPSVNLAGATGAQYTSNWTPWNNKADDYQFRDDISWTHGAHQFKFGASWALYKKTQDAFANTQGNFTFNGEFTGNDFADYLLGYAQAYNEDAVKISGQWNNVSYAAYVQDNWRATHRLTLNLGLRWDGVPHTYEANQQSSNFYPNLYQPGLAAQINADGTINTATTPAGAFGTSPNPLLAGVQFYTNGLGIGGKNGIPNGLVNNHWANFGPRIGFAYDLTGQGKTVVRGGFGIMYERVQGNDMYNGAVNPPGDLNPTLNNILFSNPANPGVITSVSKDGVTYSPATLPVLPLGFTGINSNNYKAPVSYQFSIGVQQALGARSVLALSYVGSQDRHENDYAEINLPALSELPALVAGSAPNINTLYGFAGYGAIREAENEANSHYNSLQVDLHSNIRKDLQLQFGYTLSRTIDATTSNGSGGDLNNVTNPYIGWRYDVGPSQFDRTNVAFVNFVYQLPFLRDSSNRLMKSVVGGWSLSGIVTMESGAPLNLGINGQTASSVIPNSGIRPNVTGPISYPKTATEWFNPAAFSAPSCLTGPDCYGNLGFDALRGPGRDDWNLSLFKSFVISEARGSRFELRFESFNTWNHTQFKGDANNGGISNNFGASNFGQVTGAFDPREFQLGAKLYF